MDQIKYEFIEIKIPAKVADKIREYSKDLSLTMNETIVLLINRELYADKSDLVYQAEKICSINKKWI